ncbi:MAG: apolipoprotein N-acyltransferase [Candidatus Scalinduaceae bacterium]
MNKKAFAINILFSFLTILLLSFSFPVPGTSYLAWIAFVPWLLILSTGYKVWFFSYVIGITFFVINLSWLRHVTFSGWILLSFYLAAYFFSFGSISYYLRKRLRLPYVFTVPFVWISFEYIRSSPLFGFPWFFIGHSQYLRLTLIQIADITGVYGVSFLVVMFNAAITDLIERFIIRRDKEPFIDFLHSPNKNRAFFYTITITITPSLLLLFAFVYGSLAMNSHTLLQDGPNVCLIQGNIAQSIKVNPDDKQQEEILVKYTELTRNATGEAIDLIVWPETMVPGILNIDPGILDRKIDRLSKESVLKSAQEKNAYMLVGSTAIDLVGKQPFYYNTAFYFNRKGKYLDRYDKIHLVPFGEFVPLEEYFRFSAISFPMMLT